MRRIDRGALERTGFTPALEALVHDLPEALCATFIDDEGETIDLATRVDLFEARVAGAALSLPLSTLRAMLRKHRLGGLGGVKIEGAARSVLVRQVGLGCDLVVVVAAPGISAATFMRSAVTARELCAEAGLVPPRHHHALSGVELRRRPDGLAAPRAFLDGGVRRRVIAVLGVAHHGAQIVWLVRAVPDEEVLLAHDLTTDRWDRFDAAVDHGGQGSGSVAP